MKALYKQASLAAYEMFDGGRAAIVVEGARFSVAGKAAMHECFNDAMMEAVNAATLARARRIGAALPHQLGLRLTRP